MKTAVFFIVCVYGNAFAASIADDPVVTLSVQTGHQGEVEVTVISPDGRTIATGGTDSAVILWDARNGGQLRKFIGHTARVVALSFSPSGEVLASGGWDGNVCLWDTRTGKQVRALSSVSSVTSLAFNFDGSQIAVGTQGDEVLVWNTATGRLERKFSYTDEIDAVAFAPDGRLFVSASDGTLRSWNVATGRELARAKIGSLDAVAVSTNGQWVAGASGYKAAMIWPATLRGEPKTIAMPKETRPVAIRFAPERVAIAIFSTDRGSLVDAVTGARIENTADLIPFTGELSPKTGMTTDSVSLDGYASPVRSAEILQHGTGIVTRSGDTEVQWDTTTRDVRRISLKDVSEPDRAEALTSHDGKVLAVIDGNDVVLRDAKTKDVIVRLGGHEAQISGIVFSLDDRLLITSSRDYTARVWDIESGLTVRVLAGHTGAINDMTLSPDGKSVATASYDGTVGLWNVSQNGDPTILTGHSGSVSSVRFDDSGRFLISGSSDGTARLWLRRTGELICSLITMGDTDWAVIAPDGRFDTNSVESGAGLHWVVSDDPMTALSLELYTREYFEPGLLARLVECSGKGNCRSQFKDLPSISMIKRTRPSLTTSVAVR